MHEFQNTNSYNHNFHYGHDPYYKNKYFQKLDTHILENNLQFVKPYNKLLSNYQHILAKIVKSKFNLLFFLKPVYAHVLARIMVKAAVQ